MSEIRSSGPSLKSSLTPNSASVALLVHVHATDDVGPLLVKADERPAYLAARAHAAGVGSVLNLVVEAQLARDPAHDLAVEHPRRLRGLARREDRVALQIGPPAGIHSMSSRPTCSRPQRRFHVLLQVASLLNARGVPVTRESVPCAGDPLECHQLDVLHGADVRERCPPCS